MATQCPWCHRWCVKDDKCNYVRDNGGFRLGMGCGHAFCFLCGKKLCGRMFDAETGQLLSANECHDVGHSPTAEDPCDGPEYCPGGHNSHKKSRDSESGRYR